MKVKICGITTPDDARMVADAGADAIGLNTVGGPRRIDLACIEAILESLPPFVTPVLLAQLTEGLLNEQVAELLAARWVQHVQVYGDVTADAVERLSWEGYRVIVPVAVSAADFATARPAVLAAAPGRGPAAVLLDTHDPTRLGGTGRRFDWRWVAEASRRGELAEWPPIMLAGGLTPDNVAQAVAEARPYAVDVSSGVESEPGRKDAAKVRRFIEAARAAAP